MPTVNNHKMRASRTTVVVTKMEETIVVVDTEWEVKEAIATARVAPSYRLISCASAAKFQGTISVTVLKMAIPCTIRVSERVSQRHISGRVSSPQSNSTVKEALFIAAL